jgi:hypothetical protein
LKCPQQAVTCHGLTVKFNLKEDKMTAPKEYRVQEGNESIGNQKEEQSQERTLYQQLEWVVGDSQRDLFVLGFVADLLIKSDDGKDDSLCAGYIVKDYVTNILKQLDEVDGLVYAIKEENQ